MQKPLKARLHILSPLHIGCDDVYEPTSFVIDERTGNLIEFDPLDFIKSLSTLDRQKFSLICMQGSITSIVNIYRFISGKRIKGREVETASGLPAHHKRVSDLPVHDEWKVRKELNRFAINRTAYNPHHDLPYIPGSSLKGAFRTAYLSKLAQDQKINNIWEKHLYGHELETDQKKYVAIGKKNIANKLEKNLLKGSFASDPFRMIKVSDFLPVGKARTKILYAVNSKKKKSKFEAQGLPSILETIKSGAVFEGVINIQQPEKTAEIKGPIREEALLQSINNFYDTLINEIIANEIEGGNIVAGRIKEKFQGKLGQSAFLIRLGRYSGAEAVTIEGNRFIKIIQKKGPPKFLDRATTIWLAAETNRPKSHSGLLPFGWAVLEIV